jgi:hypothetical protein
MSKLHITVDRKQALRLAERLRAIEPRASHFVPCPENPGAHGRLADCYLAWVGICQQTRTLHGFVRGQALRGSDYLQHRFVEVLDREPEVFSAERLEKLVPSDLQRWLSDDGDPAKSTVDRVEVRTALLNDAGRRLREGYGGSAAGLLAASKGRLGGRTGLFARLSRFRAYRDPARKKSFLLVHLLRSLEVFEPVDPERLGLPADYHILRIFLRSGILRVRGERAAALLAGRPMSAGEDLLLRRAAVRAGFMMAEVVPLGRLDLLLWMLGRNCCFYEHEPVCRTGPCTLAPICSFRQSTDLDCGLRCQWEGVCLGSLDAAHAAFREPSIETDFY